MTIALTAFFAGCQSTPDPSIELLESELRWYEDQLYLMNRELASSHQQLESARRYNSSLKSEMHSFSEDATPTESTPGRGSGGRKRIFPFGILPNKPTSRKSNAASSDASTDDEEYQIPNISHGTEEADPHSIPEATLGPDVPAREPIDIPQGGAPDADLNNGESNGYFDEEVESFELEEIGSSGIMRDDSVAQVVFNSRLTGGHNSDGHAGDDGLYIVLEPRTKRGSYAAVAGELTIEVFAEDQPRNFQNRIARWDFDASETAAAMRQSLLGKGVHLELSWPAEPPRTTSLVVVAKFVRSDGRRLTAERAIKIDPDGKRILSRNPF
ncbi:hypothetical protein ACFL2H_05245 [Planctomycetota bacterium]